MRLIEQVISSDPTVMVVYKLTNLPGNTISFGEDLQ